jgi:HTH-type transcriptional regulator / antitoxin HigA
MLSTTRTNGRGIANRLNRNAYTKLLADALPVVIENEAQNKRAIAISSELMNKPKRTREETQLMKLLISLTVDYERRAYPREKSEPHEILAHLMELHGLKRADLLPIFKSRAVISEVLSGKRGISWNQAKALAERFALSAEIFL